MVRPTFPTWFCESPLSPTCFRACILAHHVMIEGQILCICRWSSFALAPVLPGENVVCLLSVPFVVAPLRSRALWQHLAPLWSSRRLLPKLLLHS